MVKKGQQILVCVDPLRIGAMPESKRYFPNFIYLYEQTTEDAALSWIFWKEEKKAVGEDGDWTKNTCLSFQSYIFCLPPVVADYNFNFVSSTHNLEILPLTDCWIVGTFFLHLKSSGKMPSFCP